MSRRPNPLWLLVPGALAAACGPAVVTAPPSPTGAQSASATEANQPTASPGVSTPTPASGSPVDIDPALLQVLPEAVDGLALVESTEAEAASLGDPLLGRVASAIAAGLAIDPVSGEFVYATVVRLLPGAMDAAVFRDWRDSFDEGACSQAGGVSGHAETEIDGRTAYIGTCKGGVHTYHVWLEERGILISATAAGERRLGEQLLEGLRPENG